MKLKLLFRGAVFLALTNHSFADDVYRITNPNTLVTRYRHDLVTFRQLNEQGQKAKVRALYNRLSAQKSLLDLQPGDLLKVSAYYNDGTAQIALAMNMAISPNRTYKHTSEKLTNTL